MKNFKKRVQTKTEEELVSRTCDKCDTTVEEYSIDNEIVSVSHKFGYGTDLDNTEISFDMCKDCFMDMLVEANVRYTKEEHCSLT